MSIIRIPAGMPPLALILLFWSLAIAGTPRPGRAAAPDLTASLARLDSLHANHHVDQAEELAHGLLASARAREDTLALQPLTAKLGRLHASYGQPRKGEPLLLESASLASALKDTLAWNDALRWLGYALDQQGRLDEARNVYLRLGILSRATRDRKHEAWSLVGLAFLANRDGNHAAAVRDYRRAADLFSGLGQTQPLIWTLNGLGTALQESGMLDRALTCYEEVAALAREVSYPAAEALAENNRGSLAFARGDPGLALASYRRAWALQGKLNQKQDAIITGVNIADCLLELGRYQETRDLLEQLLADCRTGGFADREPTIQNRLARLHFYQGRYHQAASLHRQVLQDPPGDVASHTAHLIGLSRALVAQDSLSGAQAILEAGLHRLADTVAGTARLHLLLQLAVVRQARGQVRGALDLSVELLELAREMKLPGELQQVHRLRAGCFQDLGRHPEALAALRRAAATWENVRGRPASPLWREIRGGRQQAGLGAALALAILREQPEGTAGPEVERAYLEARVFQARTLQERILGKSRQGPGKDEPVAAWPATTADAGNTWSFDFFLGDRQSLAFVRHENRLTFFRLPPEEDLAPRARMLRQLISDPRLSPDPVPVQEAARHLGRLFFGAAWGDLAPGDRVVVAPGGIMHLLPLSVMLPPGVLVSRVPASTFQPAGEFRGQVREKPSPLLLVAVDSTPTGVQLPGTRAETSHLHSAFQGAELIRSPALDGRPFDLTELDDDHAVLHFATHAEANDQTPWASTLFLGSGSEATIRAERIAELELTPALVVLSGCDTGGGHLVSGEGVLGLGSAFLAAGAQAVVTSLWAVDDAVTADLMIRFYDHLATGVPVADALDRARQEVRAQPATAHPFFWAGFTLLGDGQVTVPLDRRLSVGRTVLPGALLLVLLGGYWWWRTK